MRYQVEHIDKEAVEMMDSNFNGEVRVAQPNSEQVKGFAWEGILLYARGARKDVGKVIADYLDERVHWFFSSLYDARKAREQDEKYNYQDGA